MYRNKPIDIKKYIGLNKNLTEYKRVLVEINTRIKLLNFIPIADQKPFDKKI
jgi:hypothetical protein